MYWANMGDQAPPVLDNFGRMLSAISTENVVICGISDHIFHLSSTVYLA